MADRTVSARLRLDVGGYVASARAATRVTRELADEAQRLGRSGGSFDQLRRTSEQVARSFRETGQETQRTRAQLDLTEASAKRGRSALVSLAAGGAAAGTALAGVSAAAVAFGAVAVPSIAKVISAQGDLAGNWSSLSQRQRTTALTVQSLTDEYRQLAKSYEPEALSAFNSVLATSYQLLPMAGRAAGATASSFTLLLDRVGSFATGPEMNGFLDFAGRTAPAALDQVGDALTTTLGLSLRLIQDLAPLGMSLLTVTNGALSLANGVANVNPALAQLAVTGLLLRGPVNGLVTGVGNLAGRMRTASTATRGMSVAGRALNLVTAAGPNLYLAAGTALAFLAVRAMNAKTGAEKLTESLRIQYRASGNNLQGHQTLARELQGNHARAMQRYLDQSNAARVAERGLQESADDRAYRLARMKKAVTDASEELEKQNEVVGRLEMASGLLSSKYGITADQARALATAAGVDLTQALDKNGQLTGQAATKISNYRLAVEAAKDPTRTIKLALDDASNSALSMKDRVTSLSTALEAMFNPSIAAYRAVTQIKAGYLELIPALEAARGKLDGQSQASLRARERFAAQLESVRDLADATLKQGGDMSRVTAVVREQLPILYALAGSNREARRQVDALARSTGNVVGAQHISRDAFLKVADSMGIARGRAMALLRAYEKIKPKDVELSVQARGSWDLVGSGIDKSVLHYHGGPITGEGQPGATRHRDSVFGILRKDEHVWTPEEVDAVGGHSAMYRLRQAALSGRLPRFYRGGPVALGTPNVSPPEAVDRVMAPINAGYSAMLNAMGQAFASQWKQFVWSGASVVAAARTQIGVPYVWGGTTWGKGLDCSGLTQGAWRRGRGIDITRTTYTQHPNSTPIGGPKPGALGFSSSLGHVVLASDQPGYVIEAPRTGLDVREIKRSMPDWRWPKAAAFAIGGPVRQLADTAISGRASAGEEELARVLRVAGDPGRERHDAQIARAGDIRVWAEPETQGEAYIPLAPSKRVRSVGILSQVANRFGMSVTSLADGGITSYADGGVDSADLNLSDILSRWEQTVRTASKSEVTDAARSRRTQLDQLRAAEDALKRARRSGDHDRIAAAERKVRKEREDLRRATEQLQDVEARYQAGKKPAAMKLGAALSLSIKNTGQFIRNITTLADRGFGTLAQELLSMGGPEAEKIAASAVKMSSKKLAGLERQINTSKQQQETLAAMPNILTARSVLKNSKVATWQDLIKAANLPPEDLAAALRLMKSDLFKSKHGKQIWAQMIAQGYRTGGPIIGPGGVDRVPIWATAGEYMINAVSVARHRPLVEAVNADRTGAILRNLIPYTGPAGGGARGGDGAAAPLVGEVHLHHVPGYSTPADINRALQHVERSARYHRRR